MIAHLDVPGQNLQIAYEFLANQNIRLFMYKSIHASNDRSLAACRAYFVSNYYLNDQDVLAHLIKNKNMPNEILILRPLQGKIVEDAINKREAKIFLVNKDRIEAMMSAVLSIELRA